VSKIENLLNKFFTNKLHKNLLNEIRYLNLESILDAGCGDGELVKFLKKNKLAKRVEGIDISEKAIERARQKNPHLIIKKGDIYNIQGKSEEFDLIVCSQVFEHLKYPRRALNEMVRVARKYVLIAVINESKFRIGRHEHHWKTEEFKKFVNTKGLKIVSRKTTFPWTIVLLKKQ
jgi:2-polyprenyl-3-methyl-5-hydroxy-6-metoxy-1,4-benzoquinol methylase